MKGDKLQKKKNDPSLTVEEITDQVFRPTLTKRSIKAEKKVLEDANEVLVNQMNNMKKNMGLMLQKIQSMEQKEKEN